MQSNIHVSDEVMNTVAEMAAASVPGVRQILSPNKSLVETSGKKMKVALSVVLDTSENIEKICKKIQERVKEALEGMLDTDVTDISIRVDNIIEG